LTHTCTYPTAHTCTCPYPTAQDSYLPESSYPGGAGRVTAWTANRGNTQTRRRKLGESSYPGGAGLLLSRSATPTSDGPGPGCASFCYSTIALSPIYDLLLDLRYCSFGQQRKLYFYTPGRDGEHGTRPGGRGPGGVSGDVGSKNRGGHVREYRGEVYPYTEGGLSL